jgi:hypothetical protein
MSGGAYSYKYYRLDELADDIERDFLNDGKYESEPYSWDESDDGSRDRIADATEEQRPIILKEVKSLIQDLRDCSKRAKEIEWYMSGDTGADSYLRRLENLGLLGKETYSKDELRHLAVNYAINCEKGFQGSFDSWLENINPNWREYVQKNEE